MTPLHPPAKRFSFGLQPTQAWLPILGFGLFTGLCVVAGLGSVIRYAFPLEAFLVGAYLYKRYPVMYVGFAWWIAFLAPWVRRLADFKSGWVDPSPVLLAPFLVMLVSLMTLLRFLPRAYQQGGLPFVMAIAGVVYGMLVGLINLAPATVIVAALNWLAPILFGFHLFIYWREYPTYRQNIERTFLWGTLVTGLYGVIQYLIAPGWDRYWMLNAPISTIGNPAPLQIRVFSTMNSPGPFAVVMMAGILLLLNARGPWMIPASIGGYLSFLLSQVRAAWLGWFVGLAALIPSLKPKLQMRLVTTILVMALCVVPLINVSPFSEVIGSRLQSLSNTQSDTSYNERMRGYREIFSEAVSEFSGRGLGYVITGATIGSNDSGILVTLFSLGWFGTIPYFGGILLIFFTIFRDTTSRIDSFAATARAICLGVFVQIGLGVVTIALSGMVFWTFAGMAMAAQRYHWYQKKLSPQVMDVFEVKQL
jgi:hypothetical protein